MKKKPSSPFWLFFKKNDFLENLCISRGEVFEKPAFMPFAFPKRLFPLLWKLWKTSPFTQSRKIRERLYHLFLCSFFADGRICEVAYRILNRFTFLGFVRMPSLWKTCAFSKTYTHAFLMRFFNGGWPKVAFPWFPHPLLLLLHISLLQSCRWRQNK